MSRTPKTAAYQLADDYPWVDQVTFGVVRCPAGDRVEFDRLAAQLLREVGEDPAGWQLEEPTWGWYRMNPDPSGDHAWLLGHSTGPGRGNWQGAMVRTASGAKITS